MRCMSDRTTCTLDINKPHRTYGVLVKSVVIPFSSTCQPGYVLLVLEGLLQFESKDSHLSDIADSMPACESS